MLLCESKGGVKEQICEWQSVSVNAMQRSSTCDKTDVYMSTSVKESVHVWSWGSDIIVNAVYIYTYIDR